MKRKWLGFFGRLFTFPVLLLLVLGGTVFLVATQRNTVSDPDIWWHLRDADVLMHTGSVPRLDGYSFTVSNQPWIDSEWLAEVPFWLAWKWGEEQGLFLLTVLLMQAIVYGMYYLAWLRTSDVKASLFAALAGFVMALVSFGPRPLLFGWILFVIEFVIFERWEQQKGSLWILPLLFALWINLHGSWLIGFAYAVIFAACGFVHCRWGRLVCNRWPAERRRHIAGALLLSLPALLLNPFGWRAVWFPLDMAFVQKINTVVNQEWHSIDFQDTRGKVVFALLAFLALAVLVRKRSWSLRDVVFLGVAAYAAFTHLRFVFLLGIVACPIVAEECKGLPAYQREQDKPLLNAALVLLLIAICAWFAPTRAQLKTKTLEGMPVEAVKYLRAHRPSGHLLNDIDWGGYMTWQAPEIPVFADSRDDIFEQHGVLKDYMDLIQFQSPFEVLDKYRITCVLFPRSSPIAYLLHTTPAWKPVFEDSSAVVFQRVGGGPARSAR